MRRHRRHRGLALSVDAVAAPTSNAFENDGILIVSDVARPAFLENRPGSARWLAPVLDQQQGTARAVIFTGVIVQTLIEVLLAAVAGIVIAAVLLELFARELVLERLPMPPSTVVPVESALLELAGALIVVLLASLIPAISAARSSEVQALRA